MTAIDITLTRRVEPPTTKFPNYTNLPTYLPRSLWNGIRAVVVVGMLVLEVALVVAPETSLKIVYFALIPLLPITFMAAPGIWRNICPFASANQIPRRFGFTLGRTLPAWVQRHGMLIQVALFTGIVLLRPFVFDHSGPATAMLLLSAMTIAFVGGVVFKGKSGMCHSICPLSPVQRVYGQSPALLVANTHCQPCVGCAKNCNDFNPKAAYLADLTDEDPQYAGYRKLFVAAFPGIIAGYFLPPADVSLALTGAYFVVSILVSMGSFFLLDALLALSEYTLTTFYAIAALNLFYWCVIPRILHAWWPAASGTDTMLLAIRLALIAISIWWIIRTLRKEDQFSAEHAGTLAPAPVTLGHGHRAASASGNEVLFEPGDRRHVAKIGNTILQVAEMASIKIEAGCRMGVCGSDPVCVLDGAEHLSPIGSDEQSTLDRLGLEPRTRMACSAHINGDVTVSVERPKSRDSQDFAREDHPVDDSIQNVIVLGAGVAGTTAADYIRRLHPTCQIDLVGAEAFPLYNRMGISRLIYGHTAMAGLGLIDESWSTDKGVTTWLNTSATRIDPAMQEVELQTGEVLHYDRLILAMGSQSFVLPLRGSGLPGVFVLRTALDAFSIRSFMQQTSGRKALVIGTGPLGMEAAYALWKLGLKVTLVGQSGRLLGAGLSDRPHELLVAYFRGLGIATVMGSPSEILGTDSVTGVALAAGEPLDCDIVLVCAGIRPNVDLPRQAGLVVGKGVVVDESMRTSDPLIFAAGDVAEFAGQLPGLWPIATAQAEVAARSAVGIDAVYIDGHQPMILKGCVIDLSMATRAGAADQLESSVTITIDEGDMFKYRELRLVDGQIISATMMGFPDLFAGVQRAITSRTDLGAQLEMLRSGDWSIFGWGASAAS